MNNYFKWIYIQRTLLIVGGAVALIGLFLSWQELRMSRLNQSADLVLRMDQYMSSPVSLKIIQAVEENRPLLIKNGGAVYRI